jgi:hypothetical protein
LDFKRKNIMAVKKAITKLLAKYAKRRMMGRFSRKAMTPAQKRALMKAVKASALARSKGASRRAAKKIARKSIEQSALAQVKRAGLKTTSGYYGRRLAKGSLQKAAAKGLSYRTRLNASRAVYRSGSTGGKLLQAAKAYAPFTTGVMRREYNYLSYGENVKRNIARNLTLAVPIVATQTAATYKILSNASKAVGSNGLVPVKGSSTNRAKKTTYKV